MVKLKSGTFYLLILSGLLFLASCSTRQGNEIQIDENLPEPIKKVSKKINDNPKDASLFIERSDLWLNIDSVDAALRDINTAIKLDPSNSLYYVKKADLLFMLGNVTEAMKELKRARNANPDDPTVLKKLAEINWIIGKYQISLKYLDTLEIEHDTISDGWLMRGFVYSSAGDTLHAIRSFEECVSRDPDNYTAFLQLGVIYTHLNNPLAVQYYQTALELKPNSAEVFYNLGWYFQINEEYNEAIKLYTSIISLEDGMSFKDNAYYNLGHIHIELQIYDEARDYFGMAINTNPEYVEAYYAKGFAHEMLGDVMNAKEYYKEALKMNPNYSAALHALNRVDQTIKRPQ